MATLMNVSLPTISRTVASKYDFASLEVNGPAMVELGVVTPSKVASRLQSALAAAKKRNPTLAEREFKIRVFQHEGADAVGVWRTK